jgi:hypothetical protein
MHVVQTRPPSFPEATLHQPLTAASGLTWQVLCGDRHHWRLGLYSPEASSADELQTLEQHDCPELFLLLQGRVTLLLVEDGGVRECALEPGKPVLVQAPHSGFCPDGPHAGLCLVVERDSFDTTYRTREEWIVLTR